MEEKNYHLEIESDPNNLITVEEFINYIAVEINLNPEKFSGLLLAVTEATTNAIIHANKKDISKLVTIDASFINNRLTLSIKDEGVGFDPSSVPDPTEPENLLKDSGRGLYLMKIYADELKYNITPTGTEAILVLNL